jgi:hypothetical protein
MGLRGESVIGARKGLEDRRYTPPRVFFVRVAGKGLMLDVGYKGGKGRSWGRGRLKVERFEG